MDDFKIYSFAEAVISPDHDIAGVLLRPFSLGHWIFLEEYSSPLLLSSDYPAIVSNDPVEQMKHCHRHLLLFILVCAHTYEDNLRLYKEREFCNDTLDVFETNLVKHIKNEPFWSLEVELLKIKEYLKYYIDSMPYFSEKGTPSPPSGLDWKQSVYSVLKNEYVYSESQIMNMSMRRINSEWVTFMAKNGAIMIKTKQQMEAEENASQIVADIKAGKIKLGEKGELIPCQ